MASVGSNALAVATANAVSLICALAQVPTLTRASSGAEFAALTAAIATGTYASLIIGDPLSLALQRFPGSADDRSSYRYARQRLITVIAPVLVLLVALSFVEPARFIVAAGGWGIGLASMRLASVAWLMWQKTWHYTLAIAVSTTMRTALLISMVLAGVEVYFAVAAAGVVSAAVGFACGPRIGQAKCLTERLKGPPWPRGFGISLALGSLGTALLLNFDRAVAPMIVGDASLGAYSAMATIASITAGAVLISLRTIVYPRVVSSWDQSPGESDRLTRMTLSVSVLAVGFFGMLIIGLPQGVMNAVSAPEMQNREFLLWLSIGYALYSLGQHGMWWHTLRVKASDIRNRTLLASAVSVLFVVVLGRMRGSEGMVVGVLLGMAVYAGALCWRTDLFRVALAVTVPSGMAVIAYFTITSADAKHALALVTCAWLIIAGVGLFLRELSMRGRTPELAGAHHV